MAMLYIPPSTQTLATRGTVPTPGSQRLGWLVIAIAAIVLLTMILAKGHLLGYDEPWHRMTIYALHEQGFSLEFLRGTKYSAPGPLFALVQAAFEPLTGLRAPGIRLVSVFLSCITALLLSTLLRLRKADDPVGTACGGLLGAPLGWAAYGMALTEPPALLAACAGLLLLARACEQQDSSSRTGNRDGLGLAIAGGFLLGMAVCGRQPFLVLFPALLFLAGIHGRGWRIALASMMAMAILPAGLFYVWGGLTAPLMRWNAQGIRLENLILGPAFAGFTVLVLGPRFFSILRKHFRNWTGIGVGVALVVAVNVLAGFYVRKLPLSLHLGDTPEFVRRAYGGLVLAAACLFLATLAGRAWERREDRSYLFWCVSAALLVFTPARVPFGFDVRWLVSALPFFILITAPDAAPTFWRTGRWVAGMTVSAMLFSLYLRTTDAGDGSAPPPDLRETMLGIKH